MLLKLFCYDQLFTHKKHWGPSRIWHILWDSSYIKMLLVCSVLRLTACWIRDFLSKISLSMSSFWRPRWSLSCMICPAKLRHGWVCAFLALPLPIFTKNTCKFYKLVQNQQMDIQCFILLTCPIFNCQNIRK